MARAKKTMEAATSASSEVKKSQPYLKTFDKGLTVVSVVEGSCKFLKDGSIDMRIKMSHIEEEIPFCAQPTDVHEHGRWLFEQASSGAFGKVLPYERSLPTVVDLQEELDKIWPDIVLGLATEEELSLARSLRIQIKAMS
ncbi:hypothetical protein vB_PsyM_KIL1_0078 [Pseudomonas phage vB_PsyM_KIL1]|uniref:Uncharacterized protein n=1 Tax=Pseudomonas phage vB_PsyM_KIL1 TaxID=1777065 RepID=A0A142IDM0_9CAUD|nr:tail fiber protein [Pseudomonas phage vB_PsyM_KIL1]AMR57325.1 hypothetical protein vB_PsyM_KIL1_0078 [Pseudomonas phage vB_PsyM_KIL1]